MKFYLFGWLTILLLSAGCSNNRQKEITTNTAVQQGAKAKEPATITASKKKYIVFFGNSLTAGYGVDPSEAFPAVIQQKIDSAKLPYKVINAGLSGETSAGGKSRIGWILRQPVDDFVLELGGNDGLRGIPISETAKNLQAILDSVKEKYSSATVILAGMQIPPSMGNKYASAFRELFRQLANKNKILLIPFILEGVGGVPELNQRDGIHPTAKGHIIVAETVWKVLKKII